MFNCDKIKGSRCEPFLCLSGSFFTAKYIQLQLVLSGDEMTLEHKYFPCKFMGPVCAHYILLVRSADPDIE